MFLMLPLLAATFSIGLPLDSPNPFRSGDRIDFFGDSITWQGGYLDMMADDLQADPRTRSLQISLIKRGINGGKSNDLRDGCQNLYGFTQAPFAEVLRQDRPRAVVIEIGINDVWHGEKGNPPAVYEQNLRDLVAQAKSEHVSVVLATPSLIGEMPRGSNPLDTKLDQYAEIVKKVGLSAGSQVVDLRRAFFDGLARRPDWRQLDRGVLTYDGVHMLPAGNRILASAFEAGLGEVLKGRTEPQGLGLDPKAMEKLHLVPWPREVRLRAGLLRLDHATIRVKDAQAASVAELLAGEIAAKTGVRPEVVQGAHQGSIELMLRPGLPSEGYWISVDRSVSVTASTVRGLIWGAVTLLQAVEGRAGHLVLQRMTILDAPNRPYRGLMVDVARRWHSIDVLKQCVLLCHLYKINYLQLHLSDDQAFTFPSSHYPAINSQNQHGGPAYDLSELRDLVAFADRHGVTIVPEMDIPGHSATLNRTMPDLFKIRGTKPYEHHATINFVNAEVLHAIDIMIGEMCDVFRSSPYFHMGGDEADIALVDQHPDFQKAMKSLGLPPKGQQELFRRFIGQVDDMVKKHGKKLLVWEGFGRDANSKFPISRDILVMEFENAYYMPADLLEDGYHVVNASWTPLYVVNRHVWPAKKVYEWDLGRFGRFGSLYPITEWFRAPDVRFIDGAQACSWEGPEELEIQNLRRLAATMSERIWNPESGKDFDRFEPRLNSTDAVLERLIHSVNISTSELDAKDPNGFDVPCFTKPLTIRLSSDRPGFIRYTLDGKPPTAESSTYSAPLTLNETATVRAAVFDAIGRRNGFESSMAFYHIAPHTLNLAVGKKVTVSGGTQGGQIPELAVDDNLDLASSWWAGPAPQWLQVDLGKVFSVNRIEVFPYWDGVRYYQYTVESSVDGKTWAMIADRSANSTPASASGDEIKIAPRPLRYVKVNMLKGSANDSVHLVELHVWEVAKTGIAPVSK